MSIIDFVQLLKKMYKDEILPFCKVRGTCHSEPFVAQRLVCKPWPCYHPMDFQHYVVWGHVLKKYRVQSGAQSVVYGATWRVHQRKENNQRLDRFFMFFRSHS